MCVCVWVCLTHTHNVQKMIKTLSKPVDLQRCGFKFEFHTAEAKLVARDWGSALYQAELAMAQMHWDSAIAVVRYWAMTHARYIECPPLMFVALVDSSVAQLKLAGEKCRQKRGRPSATVRRCGIT